MADDELAGGIGRAAGERWRTGPRPPKRPCLGRGSSRVASSRVARDGRPVPGARCAVRVLRHHFAILLQPRQPGQHPPERARIGIVACPATLLMIGGQFDLSVGSIAAFTAMLMARSMAAPVGVTKTPFAMGLRSGGVLRRLPRRSCSSGRSTPSASPCSASMRSSPPWDTGDIPGLTKVLGRRPDDPHRELRGPGHQRDRRACRYRSTSSPASRHRLLSSFATPRTGARCTPSVRAPRPLASRASVPIAPSPPGSSSRRCCRSRGSHPALSGRRRVGQRRNTGFELAVVTAVVLGGSSLAGGRGGIDRHHHRGAHRRRARQRAHPVGRAVVLDRGRQWRVAPGSGRPWTGCAVRLTRADI